MVRALTLLVFIATAFVVGSYAQSQTPGCFACPPEDTLGFELGEHDETTDPMFCSYPAEEGEDPNDFFCTYSKITGVLVEDHNAGLCQPNAVNTCQKRRREALPRSPRAAQQVRSPKPDNMQARSMLKKRRLDDQA
jgi:hypothetical protein